MKIKIVFFALLFSVVGWGQTVLAEWNFPNNPDDATVDAGIASNSTKTLSTVGGTSAVDFGTAGATTRAANADTWTSGSGSKCWMIEV